MKQSRFLLPMMFAFALLFAQQAGATHALHHAFHDLTQKSKQAPHSNVCEKCATYAQLASALNVAIIGLDPTQAANEVVRHCTITFHSVGVVAAFARGPPSVLQPIA
jgi:hypothetical protein